MGPGARERTAGGAALRVAGAVVLVVALVLAGQLLWIGLQRATDLPADGWQALTLSNVIAFLPPVLLLLVWMRVRERRTLADLGFRSERPARRVLLAVAAALVVFVVAQVAAGVVGTPGADGPDGPEPEFPAAWVLLLIVATVAVQASAEEILFRGYLLGAVRPRIGTYPAVLLTSLVFGLCHSLNPDADVVYVATTAALGALLALIALIEGGLWAACTFHTVWNAVPAVLSGGAGGDRAPDDGASAAEVAFLVVILVFVAVAAGLLQRRRAASTVGTG
ncbi:CPBP family intramembrane glutamic endopeptidase [Pseudonocardia sp. HH130630-07]|uniref:CPBP family intramembrane glutamic endopeptidase n=1 Tax=Pseudonocardia sp. HH130630-07 TaxID=1690815 RepID=UPI000814E81D|nr:CPBP family intramembrane glutamic endopeptidase [Pseudonocardia sp. HH130630-07]ANY09048.1 hypothetical protein AFB00_25455 [Pseudonocardia sp. HH130630-07]